MFALEPAPQQMSGKTKEEVAAECASMRWGEFKPVLTDACIAHLEPIQVRCISASFAGIHTVCGNIVS